MAAAIRTPEPGALQANPAVARAYWQVVGQPAWAELQPFCRRQVSFGQSMVLHAAPLAQVTLQLHESLQSIVSHALLDAQVTLHEPVPHVRSLHANVPWQVNVQFASPSHLMVSHAPLPWQVNVQVQPAGQEMSEQSVFCVQVAVHSCVLASQPALQKAGHWSFEPEPLPAPSTQSPTSVSQ
jgi:hypothetical protein